MERQIKRPTLSWNLEIPEECSIKPKTFYSKQFEFARGKVERFTFCHIWTTGEDILIQPAWVKWNFSQDDEYNLNKELVLPKKMTPERIVAYEWFKKNQYMSYIGNKKKGKVDEDYLNQFMTIPMNFRPKYISCGQIGKNYVFRFFRFTPHVPQPGEIYVPQEFKRIFISPTEIWTEFHDIHDRQFPWQPENYKKIFANLNRVYGHYFSGYNDSLTTYFRTYWPSFVIDSCSNQSILALYPSSHKDDKFHRTVDGMNARVSSTIPEEVYRLGASRYGETKKAFFSERLSDTEVVIRMFARVGKNDPFEYARVFMNANGVYPCYYYNGQVSRCSIRCSSFYIADRTINFEARGTFVEKRYPYLMMENSTHILWKLILSENFVIYEQLSKLGFHGLVNGVAHSHRCTDFYSMRRLIFNMHRNPSSMKGYMKHATINELLTKGELKRISIFKSLIGSNEDLQRVVELVRNYNVTNMSTLEYLAETMSKDDDIYDCFSTITNVLWSTRNRLTETQVNRLVIKLIKQLKSLTSEFDRWHLHILRDCYSLCSDAFFDDVEFYRNIMDIADLHSLDVIQEKHDKLQEMAKFATMDPERYQLVCQRFKNREYEDENFIVRLPYTPEEIVEEGSKMHHCVGTYVKSVAAGRSVILLLRRKSNIDKEYVTIELSPDGKIKQVKCKNNLLLSSASTLQFIENWIQARNLTLETWDIEMRKKKIVPSSHGYGLFREPDSIVA